MYNCLIVDDEPIAREIIQNYCIHLPLLNVVKSCGNALEAKSVLQKDHIDILFLDINMPVLDGMSFLKTLSKPPLVVFTTAYKEHALTAFDLAACDYLLKPFSFERFIIAVDKATDILAKRTPSGKDKSEKDEEYSFIRSNGKIIRISHNELMYAEAQGNYIKIICSTRTVIANMTFSNFEATLPRHLFFRVHRSFIINKSKISHIEGNMIFIDKTEIPIGSNYKEALLKLLRV